MTEQDLAHDLNSIGESIVKLALESFDMQILSLKKIHPDYQITQFRIADVILSIIGSILATFLTNSIDKGLQPHIASRILFELSGRLHSLLNEPVLPSPAQSLTNNNDSPE